LQRNLKCKHLQKQLRNFQKNIQLFLQTYANVKLFLEAYVIYFPFLKNYKGVPPLAQGNGKG
jgi:hypothetical protein